MAPRKLSHTKVSELQQIARFTRDGYRFAFTSVDRRVRESLIRDGLLTVRSKGRNALVYVSPAGFEAIAP